ncbi:MAG: putative toxin [Clostridia bacterium]|nr:putative toxin [Clostridia bacterium]
MDIKYYYAGANLLYTTDHNNAKGQEHILDPGGFIVASKRFDGAYENMYFFYNYDIRGSVTNIIKPDGTRVKGYEYDEFGNTKEVGESQFKNDVKFTGAVHDTSTGLYYMNARFYNPNSGRFLSQDSYSGNPQDPWTQHLYAYCGNNPVNMIDPTGHFSQKIVNLIKPVTNFIKAAAKEVVNYPVNVVKSAWNNAQDRTNAMNADPNWYTIGNWLTLGTFDLAKATFAPEKPLSLQHWLDSLKMATLCLSAYSIIYSSIPTKTATVSNKVNGTSKMEGAGNALDDARALGKTGEQASRITKNTKHIESMTGTAKYRIPDGLDAKNLIEVKNVRYQGYTSQIKDFHLYSKANDLNFTLYTRKDTVISRTLKELINGDIIHRFLP